MFGLTLWQQMLLINVVGLIITTLNWSGLKWDWQLEKISNFLASQSNELDWLKTILSRIVVARSVSSLVLLLAYVANIYVTVTQSQQNWLVLPWMVLSFLKNIVLEVVVIVITLLLWYKASLPTSLLVEFIAGKTIELVISTCTWCKTLKWYMQLRRVAKLRRFTIIARRSIASIPNVPGRVGRSLDDVFLDVAIIRRGEYANLNLDKLSEESSSRTNAKSLTTLVTDDTNGTNDYNSDYVNDLSVDEKSMRMLNVTAEDVMDARARILERSYWDEQDAKSPKVIEEASMQFPLKKNEKEMIDAARNNPENDNLRENVERTLRKEDITEYLPVKKEEEKDDKKIVLIDENEQILSGNYEDVSLKSKNVKSNNVDHAKSMRSHDFYVIPKKKRKNEKEEVAKIMQCPSLQSIEARNMTKPCASLVRKLEAKLCPIPVNQQEKWIDGVNRKRCVDSCQVDTQLASTGPSVSKKERYKISEILCKCHRSLRNNLKNEKHVRSIDTDGKNVEYDIKNTLEKYDGKEFRSFIPIFNMQRSRIDKSAFKYSVAYRLKKQIQKWKESRRKETSWGSKSLAETVRSSGYAKSVVDAFDKLSTVNCRKSAQTETCDESMIMCDSLSERRRLKRDQTRNRRFVDLRSAYNVTSFREKNYMHVHETETKALETCNKFTLKNKEKVKARKRYDLLSANRKLSIEPREAIELRALRAYNELTLSKDKRELEVRKKRDSSLNYGRLMEESEVPEMKVLTTYNDRTLPEDKKEMERTRGHNLSSSSQQSVVERSTLRVRSDELAQSGSRRELRIKREHDSLRDKTLSECEEDVEIPVSVSNRLSIGNCEGTTIPTHRDINSSTSLNDRYARQAHTSLNLREITRNIEWIVHPLGIILTNKNLHGQFLENGRFRESQQRDIVDDNTASTLHSAFFFKPEIVTRVFRRAQTRIDDFFLNFSTLRRQDFDAEYTDTFVCQTNNEMIVYHQDLSSDLERIMENDRNNPGDSVHFDANDNRDTIGGHGHDLCIISIGQEQAPSESQTATEDSIIVRSQEIACTSTESIQITNALVFDESHDRVDVATNDNLPVLLITDELRNFDIEMSEKGIHDVALPIEESENTSNVNDTQSEELNTDDINLDEENNNEYDRIFSHKNVDVDDIIHKIEQIFNSSNNCLDNVTSYVNSLKKLDNSRDKKYLSATNIHSDSEICENNLSLKNTDNNTSQVSNNNNNKQFDMLDNKSIFNRVFKNSLPGPSSLIKSDNCYALRSCDEEFQKLTQLSDGAATLNDQRKQLKATNDTIPQCRSAEILKLETMKQYGATNQGENRDEEANEFLTEKIFKMHSDDKLQQDDSFYFTYERNDDPGTPVSLEDGSLMEEFLNDPISPSNTSYS